jgi:predicted dehydrogenase
MATDFEEAKSAYLAVKKSGRIVQVGTQWRSDGYNMAAEKLLQSGVIGEITRIDLAVNFQEPRWRRDYSKVQAADVDWQRFLMHRPDRPFDARRFLEWQLFRDYTNGIPGLWMCHYINLVHWMMEDPYPASAVASGGIYLWKDGREHTDVFQALLEYPKGFHVSFSMSLTNGAGDRNLWYGTRGTLDLDAKRISGQGSERPDRVSREISIVPEQTTSHMQDFLECVHTRKTPRSDVQSGFSHAVAGCMAAAALETGQRIRFDRDALALV